MPNETQSKNDDNLNMRSNWRTANRVVSTALPKWRLGWTANVDLNFDIVVVINPLRKEIAGNGLQNRPGR